MKNLRLVIFLSTIVIVGIIGTIAAYFARGYRFNQKTLEFKPNGLLVANSEPTGASILVNGELQSATNSTISLSPGEYDVTLKKEGYLEWNKKLTVEKEIVTQVDVSLFSAAPSLSAITFSGSTRPSLSPDSTKVLYMVPSSVGNEPKAGLWILENTNLPLGFNREPRRIADGDLSKDTWEWSPDSREILLTTPTGVFLLATNEFTPQARRINIATQKSKILNTWKEEKLKRLQSQVARLPDEYKEIFEFKTTDVVFSPNDNKILYTASNSATLKEGIVKQLPGSSTQKQTRTIQPGKKYVYDIKEDRNFEVGDVNQPLYWFPTSHHIIVPQENKILIMDYDGTNKQTVYSGSFNYPFAYPTNTNTKLIILTNFGADGSTPNLYSLGIK